VSGGMSLQTNYIQPSDVSVALTLEILLSPGGLNGQKSVFADALLLEQSISDCGKPRESCVLVSYRSSEGRECTGKVVESPE